MSHQDILPCADAEARPTSAGLYVDTENLQGKGQVLVETLIENWPEKFPRPTRLAIHVQADQVEAWKLWTGNKFPHLCLTVSGVQHFSASKSKNSADIAIAAQAMADLVGGRITHVVVFSDDSDFISLYAAIRDESGIAPADGKVPFSWVVTDRAGTLSATVKQFVPPDMLHVVKARGGDPSNEPPAAKPKQSKRSTQPTKPKDDSFEEMAQSILEQIDIGSFKSTDCQEVIRPLWPTHALATANGATFGMEFKNKIWPILQGYGVKIANPGQKPIRYEMTQQAKQRLGAA